MKINNNRLSVLARKTIAGTSYKTCSENIAPICLEYLQYIEFSHGKRLERCNKV